LTKTLVAGDPISQFGGMIRSNLTNTPRPIYILAQDAVENVAACGLRSPTLPEDTFGVPPFGDFDITTFEKTFTELGKDGVPATKFMNEFGPFTVVLEYDGARFERSFSRDEILNQIAIFERTLGQQSVPRVTRKPSAPKIALPQFRTAPAQATPVRPKSPIVDDPTTGSVPSKD
jgi:hypothetical protein